jgi:hypothetical protein
LAAAESAHAERARAAATRRSAKSRAAAATPGLRLQFSSCHRCHQKRGCNYKNSTCHRYFLR